MTHQGWIATLSDGTTAAEAPPIPGERTSWQLLIDHIKEKEISITRLVLQRGATRAVALPPKSCDGYYQAYEIKKVLWRDIDVKLQGIGSVVGDQVYITWIDDTNTVTQDIRPLDGSLVHTTLRD